MELTVQHNLISTQFILLILIFLLNILTPYPVPLWLIRAAYVSCIFWILLLNYTQWSVFVVSVLSGFSCETSSVWFLKKEKKPFGYHSFIYIGPVLPGISSKFIWLFLLAIILMHTCVFLYKLESSLVELF